MKVQIAFAQQIDTNKAFVKQKATLGTPHGIDALTRLKATP
jgi:hypothetical protein